MTRVSCIAAATLLLFGSSARAEGLGDGSKLILGVERLSGYFHHTVKFTTALGDVETSTDELSLLYATPTYPSSAPRVAVDFFVAPNITVGGTIGFFSVSQDDTSVNGYVFNPRVGYLLPLAPSVSLWVRGGLSLFARTDETKGSVGTSKSELSQLTLNLDPVVIFNLASRFGISVGPVIEFGFSGKSKNTQVGGSTAEVDATFTSFGVAAGLNAWF